MNTAFPVSESIRTGKPPCMDCEERTSECHGRCQRYKDWRTNADLEKVKRHGIERQDKMGNAYEIERQYKIQKNEWRRRRK